MQEVMVYWLIPAEPERELFREIIRILAHQFNAPLFEPHLTLFATPPDQEAPKAVLPEIKAKLVRLKIRKISFSPEFTKTLFIRFDSSRALDELVIDLAKAVGSRAKAPADPHLSLLYKKMPAAAKKQLASTIKLPFHEVAFDSIAAVSSVSPAKTAADVETWRVTATLVLK